jgi:hypothetical protein
LAFVEDESFSVGLADIITVVEVVDGPKSEAVAFEDDVSLLPSPGAIKPGSDWIGR